MTTTATSTDRTSLMGATLPVQRVPRHHAHGASTDVRLAQKWGCQLSTAKARRERALRDVLDTIEVCLALGDTDRLGHYLSLFDAALTIQPGLHHIDAIHAADRTDAEEDLLECAYRENPTKQTARAWFDALGKEARQDEPAMKALRAEWSL